MHQSIFNKAPQKKKVSCLIFIFVIHSFIISAQPYRIYDVSPDMIYGTYDGGSNTGGKIMTVATDTRNPNIVYAVSENAGVWKSTDGGRLWRQSSRGIKTNHSLEVGPVLAVDPMNSFRLVYATAQEDYRPGIEYPGYEGTLNSQWGGLYVSLDGGDNWSHVFLPHPPIGPVCFGTIFHHSSALVLTTGGIYISRDDNLTQWVLVPNPQIGTVPTYIAAEGILGGDTVYAGSGTVVYKSSINALLTSRNPWTSARDLGMELPSGSVIHRMAVAPVIGNKDKVIVLYDEPYYGICPTGLQHDATGSSDYSLPNTGQSETGQSNWRYCNKCYGLFFAGNSPTHNRCPSGTDENHNGEGSADYILKQDAPSSSEEGGWKWCRSCQSLFFPGSLSRCPLGSNHNGSESASYVLSPYYHYPYQNQWNRCRKCQGLFFSGNRMVRVCVLNFTQRVISDLHFDKLPQGSGSYVLAAARPISVLSDSEFPGGDYNIITADGLRFYQYGSDRNWQIQNGLHDDTWSAAFPLNYDPARGIPTIFTSHDGGITVKTTRANPWVSAMFGLHAYNSSNMAGVSGINRTYENTYDDILYVPSAHNEAWLTQSGGMYNGPTRLPWEKIGSLGDIGRAYVDPALPGQVAFARNGKVQVYSSDNPRTISIPRTNTDNLIINSSRVNNLPGNYDPNGHIEPPQIARFSQILTLPGEDPGPAADYVVAGTSIIRSTDAGRTWRNILASNILTDAELNSIQAIETSGGHHVTVIYVLISIEANTSLNIPERTYIKKGTVNRASGLIESFEDITPAGRSGRPIKPIYLRVNPYNSNEIYTVDMNDSTIKFTPNSGARWDVIPQLKEIATNNGEYNFATQLPPRGIKFAPLQDVIFSRTNPGLHIAILFPGGVAFSNQPAKQVWTRIDDNLQGVGVFSDVRRLSDLIAHPYSGFLAQSAGSQRLYLALFGRGVVRIDGPFQSRTVRAATSFCDIPTLCFDIFAERIQLRIFDDCDRCPHKIPIEEIYKKNFAVKKVETKTGAPYFHLILEGYDPNELDLKVLDIDGKVIEQEVNKTKNGYAISFKTSDKYFSSKDGLRDLFLMFTVKNTKLAKEEKILNYKFEASDQPFKEFIINYK